MGTFLGDFINLGPDSVIKKGDDPQVDHPLLSAHGKGNGLTNGSIETLWLTRGQQVGQQPLLAVYFHERAITVKKDLTH